MRNTLLGDGYGIGQAPTVTVCFSFAVLRDFEGQFFSFVVEIQGGGLI